MLFGCYFLAQVGVPIFEICFPNGEQHNRLKTAIGGKSSLRVSWYKAATSKGRLNPLSQLKAAIYIVVQGVLGGLIFIGIVKGYYESTYGLSLAKYASDDPYKSKLSSWFESSFAYYYYYDSEYYWPSN